jgi:hypothetical protein
VPCRHPIKFHEDGRNCVSSQKISSSPKRSRFLTLNIELDQVHVCDPKAGAKVIETCGFHYFARLASRCGNKIHPSLLPDSPRQRFNDAKRT